MRICNVRAIKKQAHLLFVLTGVVLLGLLSGCATTRTADFVASGFDVKSVENVAVLPVLDHRIDQAKSLNLDAWVLPTVARSLKQRGYSYVVYRDRSLIAKISREALESPTREFIASLQPESARWILFLVLDDSLSKLTLNGSRGNAEMSGYLFDKANGELSWRNKEIGRDGFGGLVGMAMKGAMEKSAIELAARKMFQPLPKRKK